MSNIVKKDDFYLNVKTILQTARDTVYKQVNFIMVEAYWNVGKQIVEEEQNGEDRANYGSYLIKNLSKQLTQDFGKGFTATNLKMMRQFYNAFPNSHTLCDQLTWSHYRLIIRVESQSAREWYIKETAELNWSVRALERQIGTHYYERILASKEKKLVKIEADEKTKNLIATPKDIIKDPYVLEFLDLKKGKLTHQDVGQMDMYVRMYDDLEKDKYDNPTIGIILCTDKDNTVVKYSVLNDNENLFVSKYQMYLPSEEELKAEIERDILEIGLRVEDES